MAVEASGDRSALAQITEYLSEEGSHPTLSILEEKTLEIFQDRINYLDSDINSLLLKCDQKEFKKLLEDKGIDPSKFTSYIKGVYVVKTSSEEKVTNVAKSNFLVDYLQDEEDHRDPWPIAHLSKQNQARLLEFFNTGNIPTFDSTVAGAGAASATTRTSDDEWLELAHEADKLDIPELFDGLVKQKMDSFPTSHDDVVSLYTLILNFSNSSLGDETTLQKLRIKCETTLVDSILGGKAVDSNLQKEIGYFEIGVYPIRTTFSQRFELLQKLPNVRSVRAIGLNPEQMDQLSSSSKCIKLELTGGSFKMIPDKLAERLINFKCSYCRELETLNLPCATDIECISNGKLEELDAPKAKKVHCSGSFYLDNPKIPQAKEIFFHSCTIHTSSAPLATKVTLIECNGLLSATFPQATYGKFKNCSLLAKISLPKATEVECYGSRHIQSIQIPKEAIIKHYPAEKAIIDAALERGRADGSS